MGGLNPSGLSPWCGPPGGVVGCFGRSVANLLAADAIHRFSTLSDPIRPARNRLRSSCTYRRTGGRLGNWRHAPPQKTAFLFKAGRDGEYWFDVRTRDRSGQVRPQGPHTPELIVIVDTVPPKAQLNAVRGDAGQITAMFRIEELYPEAGQPGNRISRGPDRCVHGARRSRNRASRQTTTPNIRARLPGIRKMPRGRWRFAFA